MIAGYCNIAVEFDSAEHGAQMAMTEKIYPTSYDNNESIQNTDIVEWYWGFRASFKRYSGCGQGGAGCTQKFPTVFRATPSGY